MFWRSETRHCPMAPTKRLEGNDPWDLPHHCESQVTHPARWQRFAGCPRKHIFLTCSPAIQALPSDCPSLLFTHSLTHTHAHTATPILNLNNFLFSVGQMAKNLPATVGDPGSIPWAEKIPWRREVATPLHYSGLENPMDRGAWQGSSTWDRRVEKD